MEKALTHIRKFFKTQRRLPTYQELADMLGFASKNAAYKLAQKLVTAGYIERDLSGKLIPKRLFAPLSTTGIIKAGFPVPAEEYMNDVMSLDEFLIEKPEATFMLRVSGDSMIEAGIYEGDMVLIERGRKPKLGDIVVAHVDDEYTLKYYEKEQGRVVLVPANKNYQKIYPKQSLEIIGIVLSVIRKYN